MRVASGESEPTSRQQRRQWRQQAQHSLAHTCNLKQIFDLITDSAHEIETESKESGGKLSVASEAVYVGGGGGGECTLVNGHDCGNSSGSS